MNIQYRSLYIILFPWFLPLDWEVCMNVVRVCLACRNQYDHLASHCLLCLKSPETILLYCFFLFYPNQTSKCLMGDLPFDQSDANQTQRKKDWRSITKKRLSWRWALTLQKRVCAPRIQLACRYLYPPTSSIISARADSSILERYKLFGHKPAPQRYYVATCAVVSTAVGNAKPCHQKRS